MLRSFSRDILAIFGEPWFGMAFGGNECRHPINWYAESRAKAWKGLEASLGRKIPNQSTGSRLTTDPLQMEAADRLLLRCSEG